MAITRVWIEDGCTACGVCESTCPELFVVEDTAIIIEGVDFNEYEDQIVESAENCPVEVIKFE